MAASGTLPQPLFSRKSPIGRRGVLTLTGFGIKIRMQSGHLELEDGIGPERRTIRLAKVGHNLKRLVCISEDGFATLAALKWIADVGASFVMLNRTGRVLFVTGPNAASDVRLRRAQALAHSSGAALRIARELIDQKLAGQEEVARHKLLAVECTLACVRHACIPSHGFAQACGESAERHSQLSLQPTRIRIASCCRLSWSRSRYGGAAC
jgi:CRISPR associated protein Cas1